MTDKVLEKYHKSLQKMEKTSSLIGLYKFEERYVKFERLLIDFIRKREYDPKKCLKIVKKVEKSAEYIDFLENCLIHKFKQIEKK